MFTGLVEALGTVDTLMPVSNGFRLSVETTLAPEIQSGDSIAVNGVCLTVAGRGVSRLEFDLGPETARVSALGRLRRGASVNLERAIRADTRIGGHFVQGHVDGTGTLVAARPASEFTWMTFTFPLDQAALLIPKGAIAVDGVSLTVAALFEDRFDVQIVPFTWSHTSLPALTVGDSVNLEFDMLGKYAVRAAELVARRAAPSLP
jgi:riboflavin synthase